MSKHLLVIDTWSNALDLCMRAQEWGWEVVWFDQNRKDGSHRMAGRGLVPKCVDFDALRKKVLKTLRQESDTSLTRSGFLENAYEQLASALAMVRLDEGRIPRTRLDVHGHLDKLLSGESGRAEFPSREV